MKEKQTLSFWQIWNMTFGFLGIQVGWGLQMGNMSAIYEYLGAEPDKIPFLWLAAPLTGLIVQPIVGAMSDNTWSPRFGRRKPYFFVGALLASAALIIMPFSSAIWMAAGMLWILDASINITMEPTRAFVADLAPKEQLSKGYTMQSFFIGIGAVVASVLPFVLVNWFGFEKTTADGSIPGFVKASFIIGAFAFFAAILYTILTTKEYPPEYYEEEEKDEIKTGKKTYFEGLAYAMKNMPSSFKQLAPVQFFTWMGLFLMWFYLTVTITENVFGATDTNSEAYSDGLAWANLMFGFYSVITFIFALFMPRLAEKWGKKYLHSVCLLLGGVALLSIGLVPNKWLLLIPMTGVGIAWASIVSMPYAMIAHDLPPKNMGFFMGLFNFFIVIPEIIAALCFGWVMKELLGNVKLYGVMTGGALLVLAAVLTLFVRED